jgi:small subunit ribosomal protein S35
MTTALQGFRLTVRSCRCRPIAQRCTTKPIGRRRAFCTTPQLWQVKSDDQTIEEILSKSEDLRYHWNNIDLPSQEQLDEEIKAEAEESRQRVSARVPRGPAPRRQKAKNSFLNLGEEEPFEFDDDPEDDHDDLSTLAHGELEHHREMRHYARLAAWDMPLLASM